MPKKPGMKECLISKFSATNLIVDFNQEDINNFIKLSDRDFMKLATKHGTHILPHIFAIKVPFGRQSPINETDQKLFFYKLQDFIKIIANALTPLQSKQLQEILLGSYNKNFAKNVWKLIHTLESGLIALHDKVPEAIEFLDNNLKTTFGENIQTFEREDTSTSYEKVSRSLFHPSINQEQSSSSMNLEVKTLMQQQTIDNLRGKIAAFEMSQLLLMHDLAKTQKLVVQNHALDNEIQMLQNKLNCTVNQLLFFKDEYRKLEMENSNLKNKQIDKSETSTKISWVDATLTKTMSNGSVTSTEQLHVQGLWGKRSSTDIDNAQHKYPRTDDYSSLRIC